MQYFGVRSGFSTKFFDWKLHFINKKFYYFFWRSVLKKIWGKVNRISVSAFKLIYPIFHIPNLQRSAKILLIASIPSVSLQRNFLITSLFTRTSLLPQYNSKKKMLIQNLNFNIAISAFLRDIPFLHVKKYNSTPPEKIFFFSSFHWKIGAIFYQIDDDSIAKTENQCLRENFLFILMLICLHSRRYERKMKQY